MPNNWLQHNENTSWCWHKWHKWRNEYYNNEDDDENDDCGVVIDDDDTWSDECRATNDRAGVHTIYPGKPEIPVEKNNGMCHSDRKVPENGTRVYGKPKRAGKVDYLNR